MVVYDLICSKGHRFEGWFNDIKDLKDQLKGKQLLCPVCGDESVSRRPSTFGLVKSGRKEQSVPQPPVPAAGNAAAQLPPEQLMAQLLSRWEEVSERLEKEFDDVGTAFTEEALKMHYGVTARRNIRGQSTDDQEEMLKKEGVTVYKLPMFTRRNSPSSGNN